MKFKIRAAKCELRTSKFHDGSLKFEIFQIRSMQEGSLSASVGLKTVSTNVVIHRLVALFPCAVLQTNMIVIACCYITSLESRIRKCILENGAIQPNDRQFLKCECEHVPRSRNDFLSGDLCS